MMCKSVVSSVRELEVFLLTTDKQETTELKNCSGKSFITVVGILIIGTTGQGSQSD